MEFTRSVNHDLYLLPKMHHLPEGTEVAGRKPCCLRIPRHQAGESCRIKTRCRFKASADAEMQKKRFAEEIGMPRIIRNAIRCKKCGDIIESKTVHDFKFCSCGSCAVDGGHDYLRRCGNLGDWEELSEAEKVEANSTLA